MNGKVKTRAKVNIFAMIGWLVWKLLALFGSRYAKKKLDDRRRRQELAEAGPLRRGLRAFAGRTRT